jgi:hypothetical protein
MTARRIIVVATNTAARARMPSVHSLREVVIRIGNRRAKLEFRSAKSGSSTMMEDDDHD